MAETKKETPLAVRKAVENLDKALRQEYLQDVGIKFEGSNIILPEGATLVDIAKRLLKIVEQEDEFVQTVIELPLGHVDDLLYQLNRVMEEKFNKLLTKATYGFFDMTPGTTITVVIGYNQTAVVPIGKVQLPGLPIEMDIMTSTNEDDPMASKVRVVVMYKRRYESFVTELQRDVIAYVSTHSIFRGAVINSNFEFVEIGTETNKMIYSSREANTLQANLFGPLTRIDVQRIAGISVKRTMLLHGDYGSGKTATGKLAAQIATSNGWTVMIVRPGANFPVSFSFAMKFQPCLLFFEDVDSITGSELRGIDINNVLDVMDGILTKDAEVITVFTTNHRDRINHAMRRAGRIDVTVELGVVDEDSVVQLVKVYAGNNLSGELDSAKLFEAARGYTPVYVVEAVRRAVLYMLDAGREMIISDDVVSGLQEMRPQFEWTQGVQEVAERVTMDTKVRDAVQTALKNNLKENVLRD